MNKANLDILEYVYTGKAKNHMITEFIKNFSYIDFMETYDYNPFKYDDLNYMLQVAIREFMLKLSEIELEHTFKSLNIIK